MTDYDTTDATADLLVSLGVIESTIPNEVDHSLTFFGAVVGGKRGRAGLVRNPPQKSCWETNPPKNNRVVLPREGRTLVRINRFCS